MYGAVSVWASKDLIKIPVKNVQIDIVVREDNEFKSFFRKAKTGLDEAYSKL